MAACNSLIFVGNRVRFDYNGKARVGVIEDRWSTGFTLKLDQPEASGNRIVDFKSFKVEGVENLSADN